MKVLVVRVGRLGDLVMITPALDAIFERYPEAECTLVTSAEGRGVLRDFHPRLVAIWPREDGTLRRFLARARLRRAIRDGRFDRVYLFETHPKFARLVHGIVDADRIAQLADAPVGPVRHYAQRCLDLVEPEAGSVRWARLPVRDAARQRARAVLTEAGIESDALRVGLHPSFADRTHRRRQAVRRSKGWPAEKWGELARALDAEGSRRGVRLRVLMDLLPEDRDLGEAIVQASAGAARLLVPPPDFERYRALLAEMDLVVAPDTGSMHAAAAVGTRVVALFHGKDPADCGPFADPSRVSVLRAEESPGAGTLGLAALEVAPVLDACAGLLFEPPKQALLPQPLAGRGDGP